MQLFVVLASVLAASAQCPMYDLGTPPTGKAEVPSNAAYADALKTLDIEALEKDLIALMTTNQECWPSDDGHYGPLFVRLAWHCAGTYRKTDERGGCEGGRQRFSPEAIWPDNANLDNARALLAPLKVKYGEALSWGDLMTFAGTVAIRNMGGPRITHCFGRTDSVDGTESNILGTPDDPDAAGCDVQGNCTAPVGAVFVGLIYVNPEGPLVDETNASSGQDPNPSRLAPQIRDVFGRMGWNDSETVAIITGGHAFGRCHGACSDPPCGDGKKRNTFTSGFEGAWSVDPTKWDVGYNMLVSGSLDEEWQQKMSPAGKVQWETKDRESIYKDTMRLTADLALVSDPTYRSKLMEYQADGSKLEREFAAAWSKLVLQGSKWANGKRCEKDAASPSPPPDNHAGHLMLNVGLLSVMVLSVIQS